MGFGSLIDEVQQLAEAEDYDPEEWFVNVEAWGIDVAALERLNAVPVRYPLYFCRPEYFATNPRLIVYYRNLAMVSQKAMKDARLNAAQYERGALPPQEFAEDVAKTGREQPPLSFMATILVDRVAREAQEWLDQGKLTSVYNLTQIAEDETQEQLFLNDLTSFLGHEAEGDP